MARIERMAPSAKSGMDVFISSESVITGDLQTKSNIRIEGKVQGNVSVTGNIHIGPDAKVDGNVSGVDIQVAGVVNGNVTSTGELTLFATAKLTGDVKAYGFTVEKGAYYKGNTAVSIDSPKEAAKVIGKTDAAVSPANKF
jgi:cytoskeletal protein CcmA (bactofilin family)